LEHEKCMTSQGCGCCVTGGNCETSIAAPEPIQLLKRLRYLFMQRWKPNDQHWSAAAMDGGGM